MRIDIGTISNQPSEAKKQKIKSAPSLSINLDLGPPKKNENSALSNASNENTQANISDTIMIKKDDDKNTE